MTMATRGVRRRAADCPSSEQGPCPVPLRQTPSCYAFQTPRPVHQGTRTCRHAAPELHRSEDPRPVIRSAAPKKCRKPLPALRSLDCRRTQRELQAQSLGISECLQNAAPVRCSGIFVAEAPRRPQCTKALASALVKRWASEENIEAWFYFARPRSGRYSLRKTAKPLTGHGHARAGRCECSPVNHRESLFQDQHAMDG